MAMNSPAQGWLPVIYFTEKRRSHGNRTADWANRCVMGYNPLNK
jgi:hypothetical protein